MNVNELYELVSSRNPFTTILSMDTKNKKEEKYKREIDIFFRNRIGLIRAESNCIDHTVYSLVQVDLELKELLEDIQDRLHISPYSSCCGHGSSAMYIAFRGLLDLPNESVFKVDYSIPKMMTRIYSPKPKNYRNYLYFLNKLYSYFESKEFIGSIDIEDAFERNMIEGEDCINYLRGDISVININKRTLVSAVQSIHENGLEEYFSKSVLNAVAMMNNLKELQVF